MPRKMKYLTQEIVGTATPRGIALRFAIAALIAIIVNLAAVPLVVYYPVSQTFTLLTLKWKSLISDKNTAPLLIFGDSSGLAGVDTKRLGEDLETDVWNYCTFASCLTLNDAWMLRTYIEKHGPPERVLLVHTYDMWHRNPDLRLFSRFPLPWGYWRDPATQYDFSGGDVAEMAWQRFAPLYHEFKMLGRYAMMPWRYRVEYDEMVRWYNEYPDGFIPRTYRPDATLEDVNLQVHRAEVRTAMEVSRANRAGLKQISDLAQQYGFPVVLMNGPIVDKLYENLTFRAYSDTVDSAVAKVVAELPGIEYDRTQVTYPLERMSDSVEHVNREGAIAFTDTLAHMLRHNHGW